MDRNVAPVAKLVVVSGRSGSGKSTALHVLEDAGFYCIDNIPAVLLPQLLEQCAGEAFLARTAVSIDARNMPGSLSRFGEIIAGLPPEFAVEVIYLDADDATLIKRFSETRRRHPLSNEGMPLAEALAAEYIRDGAVGKNQRADALHIGIATVARVDVLVSWNFKHIVNLRRIHAFNAVNLKQGYPVLEIRNPREVIGDE